MSMYEYHANALFLCLNDVLDNEFNLRSGMKYGSTNTTNDGRYISGFVRKLSRISLGPKYEDIAIPNVEKYAISTQRLPNTRIAYIIVANSATLNVVLIV